MRGLRGYEVTKLERLGGWEVGTRRQRQIARGSERWIQMHRRGSAWHDNPRRGTGEVQKKGEKETVLDRMWRGALCGGVCGVWCVVCGV